MKQSTSVRCVSTTGEVYFWKHEDLVHQVNQFRLTELLLKECQLERSRIQKRKEKTLSLQRAFYQQQNEELRMQEY